MTGLEIRALCWQEIEVTELAADVHPLPLAMKWPGRRCRIVASFLF